MENKVVNINWITDNWDTDLFKLYRESSLDLLSDTMSLFINDKIDNAFHVDKLKYINTVIKNRNSNSSDFSVGATIASFSNKVSPFVIPPDIIEYINEEIPNKETYDSYMKAFISSEDDLKKGSELVNHFLDENYPSQAALALVGSTWVECNFNPNVYNKTEKAGGGVKGTANWSGCGEGLFGLTYWKSKKKLIEKMNLNTRLVPIYFYDNGKVNKMSVTEASISNDESIYNEGPYPMNNKGKGCLFQIHESIWPEILKTYLSELNKATEDNKSPLDYLLYDKEPMNSTDSEDDDHKLLYTSYLYKAGPGYAKTFKSIKECTQRYKNTHARQGVANPKNGFVLQLLVSYVLGEYMSGKKVDEINLDEILPEIGKVDIKGSKNTLKERVMTFMNNAQRNIQKIVNLIRGKYNIGNAVNWIQEHSTPATQHACASFVRQAMEAGGLDTSGRPNWAWMYIDYLPKIGFELVDIVTRDNMNNYTPEIGDIAVYQKNGNPDVPGHICMWTGTRWCSDFKQNSMIVYRNTNEAYVFRWPNTNNDENTSEA